MCHRSLGVFFNTFEVVQYLPLVKPFEQLLRPQQKGGIMGFAKMWLLNREGLIDEETPWSESLFDARYERPMQIVKDKNAAIAIIR